MLQDVYFKISIKLVEIPLEVTITHFVAVFKFAEVVGLFLDGVIGQMNEFIIEVIQAELSTTCTDVAILIEVCLQLLVDRCDEGINSEIKLPFMYQEWIVNILLDNSSAI